MKQKVAASFAVVLSLAMMLSTNPGMIMPSNIFGSSDGDDGSQDGSDSSESEQPEESEPEVPDEETAPETETETEPQLVDCPDGSQAATLAECPTATPTPLPSNQQTTCPDGSTPDITGNCPANTLTGGIQTAAPIKSLPPPPPSEPFQGCPGHVARNANGICPSSLSKDSPCDQGFHHDDAGKCVDNSIPIIEGSCAIGWHTIPYAVIIY